MKYKSVIQIADTIYILQAYPSANLEICLLGAHPFIVATQITLADNAVILLSKVETSSHQ